MHTHWFTNSTVSERVMDINSNWSWPFQGMNWRRRRSWRTINCNSEWAYAVAGYDELEMGSCRSIRHFEAYERTFTGFFGCPSLCCSKSNWTLEERKITSSVRKHCRRQINLGWSGTGNLTRKAAVLVHKRWRPHKMEFWVLRFFISHHVHHKKRQISDMYQEIKQEKRKKRNPCEERQRPKLRPHSIGMHCLVVTWKSKHYTAQSHWQETRRETLRKKGKKKR